MARLNGKVAVITGGSSGIGLATAKRFVEEGAYVFITGRRAGELEKAKKVIGRNVTTVQGDVANLADLDHLYETIKAEKGGVDIVVANAGFVEPVPFGDATPEHFDETFSINVRGTYFTVRESPALDAIERLGGVGLLQRRQHGTPGLFDLWRLQSGDPFVRAHVGGRTQRARHTSEHAESGRNRHADHRRAVQDSRGDRRREENAR